MVLRVLDDYGVQTVAGGTPLVLLVVPRGHHGDAAALVERAGEGLHEALGQGRQRTHLTQVGGTVAHAHLHRAEAWDGADVPAVLGGLLDHVRGDQVRHVGLVLVPRVEVEGQPGRGELLEQLRALRGVAGVVAAPVRRVGGQRQQVRVVVHEPVQHGQRLVPVVDPHVHVQPEDHHLTAPVLRAVQHLVVALRVHHRLVRPVRERVGSRREDLEPARVRDLPDPVLGLREVLEGLGDVLAHARDHLHGVLQELARDLGVVPLLAELRVLGHHGLEDLLRPLRELSGVPVHQGDLPLDTQGGVVGDLEVNVHGVVLSWVRRERLLRPGAWPRLAVRTQGLSV